ncbi:TetR family transcriptional regulator [Rhodococcus rhodochrous]|uniref:TetR family transcriptional regulator n=1 Tax=Rhodococcus rhodochrous TaxID=1829 RepID=UPI000751A0FD|nr:TetR family transcriptional regulator [Rhodococcus rhodochrous]MDO1486460.1 TetR/AcrR family transcriptional regulator [Rhodococcus rhodochrous]SNV12795.1 TetR family transcriptional regulator [Rhodococcus rhodochrous]
MTEQSTTETAGEESASTQTSRPALGSTQSPGTGLRPAQRARYMRIIASAEELASEGGYDAVQMRAVADRSGVALGTVYRYFPSKNHLLVVALVLEFETAAEAVTTAEIPGDSAAERLMGVLRGVMPRLSENPLRYDALIRAAMFADASSAPELDRLGEVLTRLFAQASGIDIVTEEVLNAVRIIADVWMSALVAWVAGRQSVEEVLAHMDTAVTLVFDRLNRLQRAS